MMSSYSPGRGEGLEDNTLKSPILCPSSPKLSPKIRLLYILKGCSNRKSVRFIFQL